MYRFKLHAEKEGVLPNLFCKRGSATESVLQNNDVHLGLSLWVSLRRVDSFAV